MKCDFLLILILSSICLLASAQRNNKLLHLLVFDSDNMLTKSVSPRPDFYNRNAGDTGKISLLLRLDDTLSVIDTINFDKRIKYFAMDKVIHLMEEDWFYIQEIEGVTDAYVEDFARKYGDSLEINLDTYITVLDYSGDTIIRRKMQGSQSDSFFGRTHFEKLYIKNGELQLGYSRNPENDLEITDKNYFLSKSLEDFTVLSRINYLDSFYCNNTPGFAIYHNSHFALFTGHYRKYDYSNNDPFTWPIYDKNIPTTVNEGKYHYRFYFMVHHPACGYIVGYKNNRTKRKDILKMFYVYDKNTELWDTILMPGEVKKTTMYDNRYLYGTLFKDYSKDTVFRFVDGMRDSFPKKYNSKYSFYPNLSMTTGKLYVYDLQERMYYEMEFEDRDSEFLQIIDDWMYYRVYDEIRRMPLQRNVDPFDKEKEKVLIKNKEYIPDVHYIFLKEKSPVKEEWITPRSDRPAYIMKE